MIVVTSTGLHPQTDKEAAQLALKGMWTDACQGCPHRVGMKEGPTRCGQPGYDMTVCVYELETDTYISGLAPSCETFKQIIHEWQEQYHLYPLEPAGRLV